MEQTKYYCEKCKRQLSGINFYTNKDGTKMRMCKKCITMHVDSWDESTFTWILEEANIPYVPQVWNLVRERAYATGRTVTSMTVLGKYLSSMKLSQWKDYTWADNDKIQEILQEDEETRNKLAAEQSKWVEQMRERYEKGEISELQFKTAVDSTTYFETKRAAARPEDLATPPTHIQLPQPPQQQKQIPHEDSDPIGKHNAFREENFISEDELPDPSLELTQEDRIYLGTKWGRLYTANQWIVLEKMHKEMLTSFDASDADTSNALLLICKTYLKMNEAIDAGDLEGYKKLASVYEAMRKSTNLTAAQNKKEKESGIQCIGQLVECCEKYGGVIPKMKIEEPEDVVDVVINDMKKYTQTLIYEDTSLARQIETYIKKRENAERAKAARQHQEETGEPEPELTNEDYFYDSGVMSVVEDGDF